MGDGGVKKRKRMSSLVRPEEYSQEVVRTDVTGGQITFKPILPCARAVENDDVNLESLHVKQRHTHVTTTAPLAFAQARRTCSGFAFNLVEMSFTTPSTGPPG